MTTKIPDTDTLIKLPLAETLNLFGQLDAPALSALHGEYRASLLAQQSPWHRAIFRGTLYNPLIGHWRCKAFRSVDAERGRGYNSFALRGRQVQRYPMSTLIAPSRYDGRPAYTLVYRAFHSTCGAIHMVDELRQLDDTRFLGIGTCGFTARQRRQPIPFLLSGPVAEYRGDIGRERLDYTLATEIPALA